MCMTAIAAGGVLRPRPGADRGRLSVLTPAGPDEPGPEAFQNLDIPVNSRHRLQKGETVQQLSRLYSTDVRSLQSTNRNEFVYMRRGGFVRVHNGKGLLYEVTSPGESLDSIVRRFRKKPEEIKRLKELAVQYNRLPGVALLDKYELGLGERVLLPGVYIELDTYRFPFSGGAARISSRFGNRMHPILRQRLFHDGWDIPKPLGTPVYPSRSGRVVFAGWINGYGNVVDIKHSDRAISRYGHLSKIAVKEGDAVEKGKTLLGKVGSSGMSTGPHLHFEIRDSRGRVVDPAGKMGRK